MVDVCAHGCRFTALAPAVAAAHPGDTLRVGAGTYAGGITIDRDLTLVGAGAGATVIRGGGPVVTVGVLGATVEPAVAIRGVTITGGVTRSSAQSQLFTGQDGVFALGGGVEIPPNADRTGGARVTITDSSITHNRAAPTRTVPSGNATCPDGPCAFAMAAGGGIDNWGALTLTRTTVAHNDVGSAAGLSTRVSDAQGAGVMSWVGTLSVRHSVIADNAATATGPDGRSVDGGGIFLEAGTLTMSRSSVARNRAVLHASQPRSVDVGAVAGGVHVADQATPGTIRHSRITGNLVEATNTLGDISATSGGLHSDVDFLLADDVISHNKVISRTLTGSSGDAQGDSGVGEILTGTIRRSRFSHNTVDVTSAAGDATAWAGASIFAGTLIDSVVSGNRIHAHSPNGTATVKAGAMMSDGFLDIRRTRVSGNISHASGRHGSALGGGVFAAAVPDGPPAGPLLLRGSSITGNAVTGGPHVVRHGGGVYATDVTRTRTSITHNQPDQCYPC